AGGAVAGRCRLGLVDPPDGLLQAAPGLVAVPLPLVGHRQEEPVPGGPAVPGRRDRLLQAAHRSIEPAGPVPPRPPGAQGGRRGAAGWWWRAAGGGGARSARPAGRTPRSGSFTAVGASAQVNAASLAVLASAVFSNRSRTAALIFR